MDRRKFLLGVGGASIGGSALLGSGAFSRVESQRSVEIAVAQDPDAYLGLKPLDTPNSQNYVALDDDGHLYIQIDGEGDQQDVDGEGPMGEGVNSDSRTWFDGMFEICNQGKEDACVSWEFGDDFEKRDEAELVFYYDGDQDDDPSTEGRVNVEEGREVLLGLGECAVMGLRTETFGVDATEDAPLFDGEIRLIADVDGDCFEDDPVDSDCPEETEWTEVGDEDEAGGPVIVMGLDSELTPGSDSHGPPEEHADMVASLLDDVTNGEEGILVLGGSPGTGVGSNQDIIDYWEEDVGNDSQVDQPVDFVHEISDMEEVDFGEYAMLGIVSGDGQISNGLVDAQNDVLIDRSDDIADFVNDGGGLLVKTQDGLSEPLGFLDPFGEFDGMFGIDGAGYGDGDGYIEFTDVGADLGLDDANWDSWCCWHDVFTEYPDFLEVIAWNRDPLSAGEDEVAALGGDQVIVAREVALEISGLDTIVAGGEECYDVEIENRGSEALEGSFEVTLTSGSGSVSTDGLPDDEITLDPDKPESWDDALCLTCDSASDIEVDVEFVDADGARAVSVTMDVDCVDELNEDC